MNKILGKQAVACAAVLAATVAFTLPAATRITLIGETVESEPHTDLMPMPVAGPFRHPASLAVLPDHSILVTERVGKLQLVRPGHEIKPVAGVLPVLFDGHGGLLDVALDPGFSRNATIYLSYVHGTAASSTVRVMRARLDVAHARLRDRNVIFESTAAAHTELYSGRMAVTDDGYLFVAFGDRWERWKAQSLSHHAGSIIRIRTDGSVPRDNPFVSYVGAKPEIWSLGHRNPLGIAWDRRTGRLWSHENGPQGGDELNLIKPGRNYGWPVVSHGVEYDKAPPNEWSGPTTIKGVELEGMEQPVRHWTPAIAPSGLAIGYDAKTSVLWLGTLRGQSLMRLAVEGEEVVDEERLIHEEIGRIRAVALGPDHRLYAISDSDAGVLYRLDPVLTQARRHGLGNGGL